MLKNFTGASGQTIEDALVGETIAGSFMTSDWWGKYKLTVYYSGYGLKLKCNGDTMVVGPQEVVALLLSESEKTRGVIQSLQRDMDKIEGCLVAIESTDA